MADEALVKEKSLTDLTTTKYTVPNLAKLSDSFVEFTSNSSGNDWSLSNILTEDVFCRDSEMSSMSEITKRFQFPFIGASTVKLKERPSELESSFTTTDCGA